ncbi:MAG: ATP-binding cassette domain-containing protein [Chloroflexota bacterium]|nr:MAG: ABC transporter ATP-binding protein [Chloroflexota bacterium]
MTAAAEEVIARAGSSNTTGYAIEVEDMSVWYGQGRAVHDLSMHVPQGSIYGLVGPSGAGKSTTIRVLATVQQPNAGTVLVDGVDARVDPAAARARIGYLPDFCGLYEGLTAGEYLGFYGAIYGVSPRRRRQMTDELLELLSLTDRRDDPVKSLSRGMRQKLGLARCLIHDPRILLLDEPASGLDPRSRLDLRDILQELARLRKTILISSHMLSELAEICTHLGIMRAGELMAEGPVDEFMSAAFPDAIVRMRLLRADDVATARQILETHRACRGVEAADASTLVFQFDGRRQDPAAILEQLSARGVQVTDFTVERPTLEDVFLRVTDGGGRG